MQLVSAHRLMQTFTRFDNQNLRQRNLGQRRLMSEEEIAKKVDVLLSHVWMVRTFVKHSEEAEEDDELREVARDLYDYMLALGEPLKNEDWPQYLKMCRKKLKKLKAATELFEEIQPEISSHTNFKMAALSLRSSVDQVESLIESWKAAQQSSV